MVEDKLLYKGFGFRPSSFRAGRGPFRFFPRSSRTKMEVIRMQNNRIYEEGEPEVYGVTISQDGIGGYCISVRHSGVFHLKDYEIIDLEVSSARLVRRT
jgi:hypothetical protein